jgi:hypothetical protein
MIRSVFFTAFLSKRTIASLITVSNKITATWRFSTSVSKPDSSYDPERRRASSKQPKHFHCLILPLMIGFPFSTFLNCWQELQNFWPVILTAARCTSPSIPLRVVVSAIFSYNPNRFFFQNSAKTSGVTHRDQEVLRYLLCRYWLFSFQYVPFDCC